jgi:transposase
LFCSNGLRSYRVAPTLKHIAELADAIRHALSRWERLTHFLDDGRIELDNNPVERSMRPITLNRKIALFAGSDGGPEHCAIIASLIEPAR